MNWGEDEEDSDESDLPHFNSLANPLGHQLEGVNIPASLIPTELQQLLAPKPLPKPKSKKNLYSSKPLQQAQE